MELSEKELVKMNSAARHFFQRVLEFPLMLKLGLRPQGKDILELGCGDGYGALLIAGHKPKTYLGIDLMPRQISQAEQRELRGFSFRVGDATNLPEVASESKDVILIIGALHHIPGWEKVLQECYRILRPQGMFFVEEPDAGLLKKWDELFHWAHPIPASFGLAVFEKRAYEIGFIIVKRYRLLGFGLYSLKKVGDG